MTTTLFPSFIAKLLNPAIKTIMVAGCGGGFDFIHFMNLYPEFHDVMKKKIVISSFSFITPEEMIPDTQCIVWPPQKQYTKAHTNNSNSNNHSTELNKAKDVVKLVNAKTECDSYYRPEVSLCGFLDKKYPSEAPHHIYTLNARAFTPKKLTEYYEWLVKKEQIDAILVMDGGTDSLMSGVESGLGDPIEDHTSLQAVHKVANSRVLAKILLSAGFGSDRFMEVTDPASLRAVAELTKLGGFLGSISLEKDWPGPKFYREAVEYLYENQTFRSVLTGVILSATKGEFGYIQPEYTGNRRATCYVWPLSAMLFGFEVDVVAKRSLICGWLKDCDTIDEMYKVLSKEREKLKKKGKLLDCEHFPKSESNNFF